MIFPNPHFNLVLTLLSASTTLISLTFIYSPNNLRTIGKHLCAHRILMTHPHHSCALANETLNRSIHTFGTRI